MNIAETATNLVCGDRNASYGSPAKEFAKVATVWSAIWGLETPLTAQQVAMGMIALKLCRESHKPKEDNRVDLIGYTLALDWVETGNKPNA